ncbi:MAG: alpha/beta fold hydrolase [Acidobacteriaceae bacterium]
MKKFLLRSVLVFLVAAAGLGTVFYMHPLWVSDQMLHFKLWREGVKSEYVQLGPYRIHYFEAGPAGVGTGQHQDKPLVLIHGLGARGEDWAPLIPGLARAGFHVYVPDLLGYGRSDKPDVTYSISEQEEIVRQFINSQQLHQVDLAGWSMGGWIAMKFTLDHPERVKRLIVYDSAGTIFKATFPSTLFEPKTPAQLDELWGYLMPNPEKFPDFVARAILRRNQKIGWVIGRSMTSMLTEKDIVQGRLGSIKHPFLIVWGKQDRLIPLSAGEEIHTETPQSVLEVFDGCGHLTPNQCAPRVLPQTVKFLDAQPPMMGGGGEF